MNAPQAAQADVGHDIKPPEARKAIGLCVRLLDPDTQEPAKLERFVRGEWSKDAWERAGQWRGDYPLYDITVEPLYD